MGRLELRDLVKRFGSDDNEIVAVDDLNIDIADGEFLVLVGPSGCGKSTTLGRNRQFACKWDYSPGI